jgi:hypothetical protein
VGSLKSDSFAELGDEITDNRSISLSKVDTTLRIRLKNTFGQEILSYPTADIANNTTFLTKLRGMAILPDTSVTLNKGAIAQFNILSPSTRLYIYYRNNLGVSNRFILKTSNEAYRFNAFRTKVNAGNVFGQNKNVYVQSHSGLSVKVLDDAKLQAFATQGDYALAKAELVFKADMDTQGITKPYRLMLYPRDNKGYNNYNADFLQAGAYIQPGYGGIFSSTDTAYIFNLNIYYQKLLSGYRKGKPITTYGLNLFLRYNDPNFPSAYSMPLSYYRVGILKNRAFIRLTYTKI